MTPYFVDILPISYLLFQKSTKLNTKECELQNTLQTQEGLLHNKDSNRMKSKKKAKTRQSKNALANISNERANNPIADKYKDKFKENIVDKHKSSSKYFEVLSKHPKEDNSNAPLVVLHHRGEKPFQKSKERISIEKKHHLGPDQIQGFKDHKIKKINESIDNSQSKCKVKVDDNSYLKHVKPSRDKIKNRHVKCALRETPNVIIERKLKVKKSKPSDQIYPVVDSSSNPNDFIINQMKSLPIRIEDNPLTFMNLLRTANVFNGYKDQKKFDDVMKLYCKKLKHEVKKNPNDISKRNSKEHLNKVDNTESLRKLYMHKKVSSKLVKGASSKKRLNKFKNRCVILNDAKIYSTQDNLENIPESLNSLKSRKDHRRKRTKYLTNANSTNNTIMKKLETLFSKEKIIPSIKVNPVHDDYLKQSSPTYRLECGDGLVDEFSSQPSSQNNKLSTIYSESITTGMAEKDSTEMDPFVDNANTNYGDFETLSKSNTILRHDKKTSYGDSSPISTKDVGKISIVKPTVSEDGKKLMFQLVKADFGPKKISKLNKQLYRIDNKRLLKASKESLAVKNDKLMLFYTERESSCTSKDSMNIAISRDTEMCNNGSSNNVLNVVIKQTKSVMSNSKTAPSRDFDLKKEDCQGINELNFQRKTICNDGYRNANENDCGELTCRTHKLVAGNQLENSATATNSEELDSKQLILHQIENNQNKNLINSEFGFCCLQHSPETNKRASFENRLINKLLKLNSLPETIKIKNTPRNVPLKKSKLTADSKNHLKNDINSPKRNKFYTVFNPNVEIESLKKSSTQIGYLKTKNEITDLLKTKNKHDIVIQSESINDKKPSGNNGQSEKDMDNLGFKLQVIGLTKKNSFIKLVESESVQSFSKVSNNINKTAGTSELKKEERNVQLLGNNVYKENKKEYYIPTKQNNVSDEEDTRKKLSIFKMEKPLKNNYYKIEQKDGLSTESKGDNIPMVMKKPLMKEGNCEDDFKKAENVKQKMESFITVLPAVVNNIVETDDNFEAITTTLLHEQVPAKKEEVMVYSEVGVQTDFTTVQSKNKSEIPFKKSIHVLPLTEETKIKPLKVTNYKNKFSQDSNKFENNKMVLFPVKKGSFVHIVKNNYTNKRTNLSCGNRPVYKEPIFSTFNETIQHGTTDKNKILSQLMNEKHQTDEQVINKVNAIHEFLQYLDKVLKNTALTKQSEVCELSSNNMDTLNKTLRCLCTNCIEILNKIEVNQLTKNQDGKCLKSPEKRSLTQYTKKQSHFVSQVSPQRELEWRKNDESHVEYVNISEVEKPADRPNGLQMAFLEPKTHKWNPKPFFVVVPSNETFSKNLIHQSGGECGDVIKQSLLQNPELKMSEFKNVFNSNKLYFQMEDEIDDMLLKKKINNSKLAKNKVNNSAISYNGTQPYEQRFKKHAIDKHNIHDEFACDIVDKEKDCSVNGLYKQKLLNHRLEKCNSSGTLPHFSSKCTNRDKNTFLKVDGTNSHVSSRRGKNLKSVNSDSSLELRSRKTNCFAENNHFVQNDSYVCRNKCNGDSLEYLQSTESKLSDNIYEQNLVKSKQDASSNFENIFSQYGDGHERKAKQCIHNCDLLRKKEMMVLSRNRQSSKDIPHFLSSNINHQLKSESCQSSVRKICKNTSIKNNEKLLTGSVSKNKQSMKLNGLNNKTNRFQGIQNIAKKETVFLRPTIHEHHEHEEQSYNENNCCYNRSESNPSLDSYTCTGSLGKSSIYQNNSMIEKKPEICLESRYFQNEFSICKNNVQNSNATRQLIHNPVFKENHKKLKNALDNKEQILDHHGKSSINVMCSQGEISKYMGTESKKHSKFSLRKLDSNSSIDSLFSQNKETLVFTNRQFPCNEGLSFSKNSFDYQQEVQELSQSNENTVCDSPGWISIGSCESHNENKNAILKSVLSNDLEKVRLQMDIKLNDIMHVEFFCQPSDPLKLSKEKNK